MSNALIASLDFPNFNDEENNKICSFYEEKVTILSEDQLKSLRAYTKEANLLRTPLVVSHGMYSATSADSVCLLSLFMFR